jgi:hypothetical protein
MPPVRFEPTIPATARPQTYALDRAATVIGVAVNTGCFNVAVSTAALSDRKPASAGISRDSYRAQHDKSNALYKTTAYNLTTSKISILTAVNVERTDKVVERKIISVKV